MSSTPDGKGWGEAPLRWKRSGPRADAGDATHAGTTTGRGDNGRGTGECPEVLTPRARVTRVRHRGVCLL